MTGHGVYFADNPGAHAHAHTKPNDQDQTRVMYYNKVALGKIYKMNEIKPELKAAPIDYHSVHGTHPGQPDDDEYIIYRYGQALPYLKITYRVEDSDGPQSHSHPHKASNDPNSSSHLHPPKHKETNQNPKSTDQPSKHPENQSHSNSPKAHHDAKHLSHRPGTKMPYQQHFLKEEDQHFKFHVVCYNILAQQAIEDNSFLYENCSESDLKWHQRKDRLLRELLRGDADILCLQEMQKDHYENDFQPKLKEHGYDSIYLKRNGNKVDGCCLFYKRDRLKLIRSKTVPFYRNDIQILNKDNCGLIALFQPLIPKATPDDLFCVATTHLLYAPKSGDIKLAQTQYFLAEIDRFARQDPSANSCCPIILCGDLNSQPQSPLIQFLLTGYIKYDDYRCTEISGQIPSSAINKQFSHQMPSNELLPSSFITSDCRFATSDAEPISSKHNKQHSSGILTHDKGFKSVYDLNEPFDVTSHIGEGSHLIDYILYTQGKKEPHRLNLLSRLDLFKPNQMNDIHLPNHEFPSDHFLLSAKFALKLKS